MNTIHNLLIKAKALVAKFRVAAAVVAGFAAQIVALNVLSGTALHVVQAVLAVATLLGAQATHTAAVKAARVAAVKAVLRK